MAENTAIEWCDSTFNPWTGCMKVSHGCDHCYAESWSKRAGAKVGNWGPGAPRVRTSAANWRLPVKWNAEPFIECASCSWRGEKRAFFQTGPGSYRWTMCPSCAGSDWIPARRRVFCASLADWLDNEVPSEWLVDLLALIRATPALDWLPLSKRIGNWRKRMESALAMAALGQGRARWPELAEWIADWLDGRPPAHVWLGATIVNQEEADRDIPKLLAVPARVRFLSMEPLLGPVDLGAHLESRKAPGPDGTFSDRHGFNGRLHWVIVGGESGHHARPMHPDWARSLRDQCAAAGVPFLFKQWGEWAPYARGATDGAILATPFSLDDPVQKFGKKLAGRLLDGRTHDGFPAGVATDGGQR